MIGRPSLHDIREAAERIAPFMSRTPLIPLGLDLPDREIFLKLETLTPMGAFKLRPALNALLARDPTVLRRGVAVASSGNMAYGMAWAARALGVPMAAYMYAGAPRAKIEGVQKLGGDVRFISPETWWRYITAVAAPDAPELLINPVTDPAVLAGNGTIGIEIVKDLPDVDCILTPFGGGSLTCGVASAARALRPQVRIIAVEGAHAAPATAALDAGRVCEITPEPSFVKSIGGPSVVPALWPLARDLIDGTSVVSLASIVGAMRSLFSHARVVAEGAGAASLAAALVDPGLRGKVVCIISGGNIDAADYALALDGRIPPA